jgi:hypothetical protein
VAVIIFFQNETHVNDDSADLLCDNRL